MTESKTPGDKRAQHVALFGCLLQLAAFVLIVVLSYWSDSVTLAALARVMLVGVPLWFILYLVLNQIRRMGLEVLETEELRRAREAGADQGIFELEDEGLLLEQNRLRWMVKWLLPVSTVLVSLLLIGGYFFRWGWSLDQAFDKDVISATTHPTMMMWVVIGMGFFCFLYARYALALAKLPQWGLLRAGAACMAGAAMASVLTAVALMATLTIEWAEPLTAYLLRVAVLLLGIEFAINFILDLYRPRAAGELPRPSFDSRLLGMIAEPGGLAKSIAGAINYQFGFQVSSTWFYQLLQRALFPIVVVAFVCVMLLTSVVIVDADEQAVVERFGELTEGELQVLQPGFHAKWPYPVDVVQRAPVKRIHELVIGEALGEDHQNEAIVWTHAHESLPHLMLLVATPGRATRSGPRKVLDLLRREHRVTQSVAVSLLMVSVPIEYRIKDLAKYLYTFVEPEKLLEVIAYQYLSNYAAGVDIDRLMGPERETFNRNFRRRLQERLDELDTGIEVVFAGLRAAHPPAKKNVAQAFENVVASQTAMGAMIHRAHGESQRIQTATAGDLDRAKALDEAILAREVLGKDSAAYAGASQRVEDLLVGNPAADVVPAAGEVTEVISNARARASRMVAAAAAKARVFETELAAYTAAPNLYRQRRILDVYADLGSIRKYLIVGDRSNVIVEYETAKQAGLDEVLQEGVEKEKRNAAGGS